MSSWDEKFLNHPVHGTLSSTSRRLEALGSQVSDQAALKDKKSEFMLYKDLGETITFIDYPYWRTGEEVRCNQ